MQVKSKPELLVIPFSSPTEWEMWLALNYETSAGIWLRFYKKGSGVNTIIYSEALDTALCYGWIDSQLKTCDEISYLQKFTPRRAGSLWSKRNIGLVERLEKEGRMKSPGLIAVEAAIADGRWDKAYDSPGKMSAPDDLLEELKKDQKAFVFYESQNKTNIYSVAWRLQTAKNPVIREKRLKQILAMMAEGKKFQE